MSAIGSKEFQDYCNKASIPNNHRIWANCMWKEAQRQAKNNPEITSSQMLALSEKTYDEQVSSIQQFLVDMMDYTEQSGIEELYIMLYDKLIEYMG